MKIILPLLIIIIALTGCRKNASNESFNSRNNYEAKDESYQTEYNSALSENSLNDNSESVTPPIEQEIASYSTTIKNKDSSRQNNISITCSALNESIVKAGDTFSFCNTVGKATPERGYQKADIFDSEGNVIPGYGGGNCQISSTLYNAVLKLDSLEVVERSPHSAKVDYVESGKDAAVAYGSVDFKFKNNYDYDIKIYASCTEDDVTIKIFKIF